MENTVILAQFFGVLYFVVSFAALIRYDKVHAMLKSLRKSRSAFFGLGTLVLTLGLLVIMLHNDWQSAPGIVIGIIGWGAILESLLYLFLPRRSLAALLGHFDSRTAIAIGSLIGMAIGLFLLLAGLAVI